jgi:Mg-chelatase subunit ChlD
MPRFRWLLAALTLVAGCGVTARVPVRVTPLTASGHVRVTVDAWARMSKASGAIAVTSKGAADVPDQMREINRHGLPANGAVDLVYVVDTTGSMGDDIDAARTQMRAILADLAARNPDRRVGIVAYRDRGDPYVAMVVLPLTDDEAAVQTAITSLRVGGGGDVPEHVYAALDMALGGQPWRPTASHHIVLIGDAPPHEDYADDPRTYASVMADAARLAVKIHTIGVHCDEGCQGAVAAEMTP